MRAPQISRKRALTCVDPLRLAYIVNTLTSTSRQVTSARVSVCYPRF